MIRQALRRVGTYFYMLPTYRQAKLVIWDSITNDGTKFLDFIPKELIKSTNSQEMKIVLINGSIIQLLGSDSYDSIVGSNPRMIVMSEYALCDPRALSFFRPILNANGGTMMLISTPRGKNHLWELANIAMHNPNEWFYQKLTLHETQHISWEEIEKEIKSGEISEDLAMQEYLCFPTGTQVLGINNLVNIENIKIDDLVISHSGRPRKVLGVVSREYKGELITITSFGSYEKIICTPNHPIRVYNKSNQTYEWKPAGLLNLNDKLVFPKMNFNSSLKVMNPDMCLLIAWYICDGSSFKNGLNISIHKYKKLPRVKEILDRLNIEYSVLDSKECESLSNITIYDTKIVDFLRTNFGTYCDNKNINFSLISGFEDEFFHELMKGDGCYSSHDGYYKFVYTTTSKVLAYQIQILANSLNRQYAAGISKRKGGISFIEGRMVNCKDSYQINIAFQNQETYLTNKNKLSRTKYSIAADIISIEKFNYDGLVHNIKVQYDESYIVSGRAVHNCSFDLGVEGAYYIKYIDKMRLNGQIGIVPWEPAFKVDTAWDIGVRDSTSIIWFQKIGQTVRIIDYYEKSKEGLEHYAHVINNKPYNYGKHWAPHDIAVTEFGSGLSRLEKARQLGIKFETRDGGKSSGLPNISIEDGIEACRSAFSRIWIDEQRCAPLIKALENYRQEFDSKRKVYRDRPLHDNNSHAADCFRYMVLSLSRSRDGQTTADELEKRYLQTVHGQESMPGFFRDDHRNIY